MTTKNKFSKLVISALFIFSLTASLVKSISPEDDQAQNEMMASLFQEMGLDKAEFMTRENLRTILDRLLSKMSSQDYPDHAAFFKRIIEKYTSEVPEKFPRLEIGKYLNQDRIMNILQDVVKEHYGEKYAEDLKPAFAEVGNAYKDSSENVLQEQADNEGQNSDLSGEGTVYQSANQEIDREL